MVSLPYSFNVVATICVDTTLSDAKVEYPLMGNVSADERRLLYWRLAWLLMLTSKQCNPQQGHYIYTNDQADAVKDGVDIRAQLSEMGVTVIYQPFIHFRMPEGVSSRFANAFYKLETHEALSKLEKPSILLDTDVIWVRRDAQLENLLATGTPLFYDTYERSATPDSRQYAGTSMRDFGDMFRELDPTYPNPLPVGLGGEVAAASPEVFGALYADMRTIFSEVMRRVKNGIPLPGGESGQHLLNTEDQILSMAVGRRTDIQYINPYLKRFYNIGYLNNLKPGDERKVLWHLPAEKHRGLANLCAFIDEKDPRFWTATEEERIRFIGAVVGVPKRTIRRSTDPSYLQEQIKIWRGRAGIFRNKLKERLGIFHHH